MKAREWSDMDSQARTLAELEGLSSLLNAMSLTPIMQDEAELLLTDTDLDTVFVSIEGDLTEERTVTFSVPKRSVERSLLGLRGARLLQAKDGSLKIISGNGDELRVVRSKKTKRSLVAKPAKG